MSDNNYAGRAGLSAVFAAIKSAINEKVSKEVGKELSTNDYTDHDKNLVNTMEPYLDAVHIGTSGNPIVVQAQDAPVLGLDVALEPIQDLHGLPFPYVGGTYKNKLPMTLANIKAINTGGTWADNVYVYRGVTFTINTDSGGNIISIKANGTASDNATLNLVTSNYTTVDNLGLSLNTAYILSGCPSGGYANTYNIRFDSGGAWAYPIDAGNGITFTFESDTNTYKPMIYIARGVTISNLLFYPMIRLATESDATFAPYSNLCPISGRTEARVDDVGKNIFRMPTWEEIIAQPTEGGYKRLPIKYEPNTTYYLSTTYLNSYTSVGTGLYILMSNNPNNSNWKSIAHSSNGAVDGTITTDASGLIYFAMSGADETKYNTLVANSQIQLEHGESGTPYEPYQHSSAIIQLGTTVYGARINFKTGEGIIDRVLVDMGTLTYGYSSGSQRMTSTSLQSIIKKVANNNTKADILSSIYIADTANNTASHVKDASISVDDTGGINIYDSTSGTDPNAFKTVRTGQTICYPLATPIELTLTPAVLNLLKGYNYITGDGDMSIMYVPESILPTPPTTDGTYKLICTVSDGVLAFSWESDL